MVVDDAIKQVSKELGIDEYVVRRAYYSMFEFIKDTVTELSLKKENLSKKELEELPKVFYIPKLGKIDVPYNRYKKIWEVYTNKRNKSK